ncbi:hypothetical protein BLOT_005911, partial [Blomia tropicalis]
MSNMISSYHQLQVQLLFLFSILFSYTTNVQSNSYYDSQSYYNQNYDNEHEINPDSQNHDQPPGHDDESKPPRNEHHHDVIGLTTEIIEIVIAVAASIVLCFAFYLCWVKYCGPGDKN